MQNSKKWVYADLALRHFNPDFPGAIPVTPRQFVLMAYLRNKIIAAREEKDLKTMREVTSTCHELASWSLGCFEWTYGLYLMEGKSLKDVKNWIESSKTLLSKYPEWSEKIDLDLRVDDGKINSEDASAKQEIWIQKIAEKNPKVAARILFELGRKKWGLAQEYAQDSTSFYVLLGQARDSLTHAITLDSHYLPAFRMLGVVAEADRSSRPAVFEFLHVLTKKDSSNAVAHYLAVAMALGPPALLGTSPADRQEQMKKIGEHIEALNKLEPNHPEVKRELSKYLIYEGRMEEALSIMEKAVKENKRLTPELLFDLSLTYSLVGKRGEALQTLQKMVREFPAVGYEMLFESLEPSILSDQNLWTKHKGTTEEEKEMAREDSDFLAALVALTASHPSMREKVKTLYARLLLFFAFMERENLFQNCLEKIGSSFSRDAERSFLEDHLLFLKQFKAGSRSLKFAAFEEKLRIQLAPHLSEAGKKSMTLGYMVLIHGYLLDQNSAKAKETLQAALQWNSTALSDDVYGEWVIRELFTPIVADKKTDISTLESALESLELAYEHKSDVSSELRQLLKKGYEILLESYPPQHQRIAVLKERLKDLQQNK